MATGHYELSPARCDAIAKCADKLQSVTANDIIAAKLMVCVNTLGLGADALVRKLEWLVHN
eukprot:14052082-Heterocapsa_arctica.AAC.1